MKKQMQALTAAMTDSISNVLETMFFLPLDISDTIRVNMLKTPANDAIIATRLGFSGPFKGHFGFFIPKKLAKSLTADFLGQDPNSISDDQTEETVKEIINMLAGDTLSSYDSQAVFDLQIPELVCFDEVIDRQSPELEAELVISFHTTEDHLALQMVIEA